VGNTHLFRTPLQNKQFFDDDWLIHFPKKTVECFFAGLALLYR